MSGSRTAHLILLPTLLLLACAPPPHSASPHSPSSQSSHSHSDSPHSHSHSDSDSHSDLSHSHSESDSHSHSHSDSSHSPSSSHTISPQSTPTPAQDRSFLHGPVLPHSSPTSRLSSHRSSLDPTSRLSSHRSSPDPTSRLSSHRFSPYPTSRLSSHRSPPDPTSRHSTHSTSPQDRSFLHDPAVDSKTLFTLGALAVLGGASFYLGKHTAGYSSAYEDNRYPMLGGYSPYGLQYDPYGSLDYGNDYRTMMPYSGHQHMYSPHGLGGYYGRRKRRAVEMGPGDGVDGSRSTGVDDDTRQDTTVEGLDTNAGDSTRQDTTVQGMDTRAGDSTRQDVTVQRLHTRADDSTKQGTNVQGKDTKADDYTRKNTKAQDMHQYDRTVQHQTEKRQDNTIEREFQNQQKPTLKNRYILDLKKLFYMDILVRGKKNIKKKQDFESKIANSERIKFPDDDSNKKYKTREPRSIKEQQISSSPISVSDNLDQRYRMYQLPSSQPLRSSKPMRFPSDVLKDLPLAYRSNYQHDGRSRQQLLNCDDTEGRRNSADYFGLLMLEGALAEDDHGCGLSLVCEIGRTPLTTLPPKAVGLRRMLTGTKPPGLDVRLWGALTHSLLSGLGRGDCSAHSPLCPVPPRHLLGIFNQL